MDPIALYPPKRFFGSARNTEEGGSLTIIATCLVETGSRMDEVIFEEFKGTGNMELRLSRRLAEKRVYPAIDVLASSTRREDLLFSEEELRQVWLLRRMTSMLEEDSGDAAERVIERLSRTTGNEEFLATLKTDVI
jgi:transcription termination factor Rho